MRENESHLSLVNQRGRQFISTRVHAHQLVERFCSGCVAANTPENPCLAQTPAEVVKALGHQSGACGSAALETIDGRVAPGILIRKSEEVIFKQLRGTEAITRKEYFEALLENRSKDQR